tara:strand:+ start:1370 stop:2311 length:942 start_codon:yes stop_codon:yes gene_type:complete
MLTSRIEVMKKVFLALMSVILFGCKPSVNDANGSQVQVREVQIPDTVIEEGEEIMKQSENNPIATIKTNMGDIVIELYEDAAPNTVASFVSLADSNFYNGVIFHRIIKGFMAQGGDPQGTGTGGPGYRFANEINGKALGLDEIPAQADAQQLQQAAQQELWRRKGINSQKELQEFLEKIREDKELEDELNEEFRVIYAEMAKEGSSQLSSLKAKGYAFDESLPSVSNKYGTISMANAGPGTNGSQFFINHTDNVFLDGMHTVFGKVIEGMNVVDRICNLPTDGRDRPVQDVEMVEVIIENKRDHDYSVVKIED